jgi:hypothetical protein
MPSETTIVVGDGTVTALAGGPVSIADMGTRTTKRASHLRFNEDLNEWVVQNAQDDEVMFTHPDYDVALQWEIDHFNKRLSMIG